jgi:predicted metal-binding transcription factor (methanogenesis marker protein 9)
MGGDYRALTFCCKPGMPLAYAAKCRRDEKLKEIGLSPEKYIEIKDQFSGNMDWDDQTPCFGSLSYCCMRASGCPRRDAALLGKYPDLGENGSGELRIGPKIMAKYFAAKRQLAKSLLQGAKHQKKVQFLLDWDQ